ncbi:MAG: tetratricopeptide repeat protein, partial [Bacteroidales bacterium]|nr:tetratricopeptide repeat protein [Bacteroidales bacterium]
MNTAFKKKYIIVLILGLSVWFYSNGQKTFINQELNQGLKKATLLQQERNYAQAFNEYSVLISKFENIAPQKQSKERLSSEVQNIYFNRALCAYYLMNNDVDVLFKEYKTLFPNSLKLNRADFYTANWYSQKGEFLLALNTYANMDTSSLSVEERGEYNYKIGYCYFLQNMNNKAKIHFAKIKDSEGKYSSVAKYYYGHILYTEGKYDLELNEFEALKKNKHFSKVVPYYICQIYYFEGNYDAWIEMAPSLSKNALNSKRATELNRMLGDAYYKLGEYENAIPYIKQSISSSQAINRDDNYLMAYCLMETGQPETAIPYFEACLQEEDTMCQNALYSLGYCYLLQKDSVSALNSYKKASLMDFDKEIREDALFSYAKLTVINPNPYNESLVNQLNKYIKDNSGKGKSNKNARLNEARICLAQIYERTRNYAAALEQMEQIKNRDSQMNKVYVKTILNRGIELFNDDKYNDCIKVLNKIDDIISSSSNEIAATSRYIKAESFYRTNAYQKAELTLRSFYTIPESENNRYRTQADYLMAYTLFKQKKYSLAKDYFSKIESTNAKESIKNDSKIRMADCEYMLKNYSGAIKSYNAFINTNSANSDYASYQKAMAEGATGEYKTKINTLQKAISSYPASSYLPAMTYELANTYLAVNDNAKASETYQIILKKYPDNVFTKDCLGKVGMLQYQAGNYDMALSTLDKLIRNYPNSKQSQAALATVKNIYMDKGRPEDYITYANSVSNIKVSKKEEESLLYQSAENKYMDEQYSEAIKAFNSYLASFPQGNNSIKAEYYLADCYLREKDSVKAGENYYKVGMSPYGQYTEKSLLNAAKIYKESDIDKAIEVYTRLDGITGSASNKLLAKKGIMTAYYDKKDYSNAIKSAENLLNIEGIDEQSKENAYFVLANSYSSNGKTSKAEEYINELKKSDNPKYSSFAQYASAESEFRKNNFEESERIIRQMSKNGADDYYLALGFILWSDIFVQTGNDFQAKQTLQSVIDNYDGDTDVIYKAVQKLNDLENKNNKEKLENEEKL